MRWWLGRGLRRDPQLSRGLELAQAGPLPDCCPGGRPGRQTGAVSDNRPAVGDYAIQGGPAEEHRLAVLAQIMSAPTTRLFHEIGVGDGWDCLDVGCGGGQVSTALAATVAP